jgi:uncharacterized integral membrane protein
MRLLGVLILLALALFGAFVVVNWSVLATPTTLSFLTFTVVAPLGIIQLAVTLGVALLCAFYVMALRTSMLLESRRHAKELRAQRALADEAEGARLTELAAHLDRRLDQLLSEVAAIEAKADARGARLEQSAHDKLEQGINTISAYLGELDEKLDRALPNDPGQRS